MKRLPDTLLIGICLDTTRKQLVIEVISFQIIDIFHKFNMDNCTSLPADYFQIIFSREPIHF